MILLFKYQKYQILGKKLAEFLYSSTQAEEEIWWDVQAIIPVPLHASRKKERGFNQAEILCKELAKLVPLDVISKSLIKSKKVPPQTSLTGMDRRNNVTGAFSVVKKDRVKDKILLLVDDVYTTGATVWECCNTLLNAGAKEVRAITLARAQ